MTVQPSARSLVKTSSARSSMMPEHRNRPPSFRKGRTLPESPITVTCKDLSLSWRNGLPQTGVLRTSPAVRLVLEDVRVEGVN